MPLFTYECTSCGHIMEKFMHAPADNEIECEKCGDKHCIRHFPIVSTRVWQEAKEFYRDKIAPDAKRIVNNINRGRDKDFLDVCGDE